ncbi:MAG: transglycosylase domain-containing protein [Fimbriimonas sp.]|nr:transglycosylase domain-containing protein [Fimbriimonas sp.]
MRRLKLGILTGLMIVLVAASVVGGFFLVSLNEAKRDMADLQSRIDSVNKPTSTILSADGEVLFRVTTENRILLKLRQIPKYVQNAVLAAEDKRFYQHSGVDFWSLARAGVLAARDRRLSQGGSTITMQLVKLLFNGSRKTFRRKMNDIAYATAMEENLPKDQILELYLNKVFFGEGAFGIGEAAKVYLNKSVDELTIGEAAMLARCIRLPSKENPIRDLNKALENRDIVLGIMKDEKMITQAQYEKAIVEKPRINPKPSGTGVYVKPGAEYFVDHVKEFVEKDLQLHLSEGGYTIETSLDFKLQRAAEEAVREVVEENRGNKVNQGAFMVMDSDGRILAEVGGTNYRKHQFNIITHGTLQPGSGFKAILYATALKDGAITMDSMLSNAPITKVDETGKVWHPGNSSRSENRPEYSLRTAFASSINLCAIHTIEKIGPDAVVETAHDAFGFRSRLDPYETLALGASAVAPIEMAEAYSVFMLRGDRVRPQPVVRVLGEDGSIVKQYDPQRFVGVFDAGVCDEMDQLLRAVVEEGTGQAARPVPDARGKTGTTNDAKDAWFTGYTDGVLGVGWVGNEQKYHGQWVPRPMADAVYGGTVTARIWAKIMAIAQAKYGKTSAPQPAQAVHVDPKSAKPTVPVGAKPDDGLAAIDSSDAAGKAAAEGTTDAAGAPINEGPPTSASAGQAADTIGSTEGAKADAPKPKRSDSEATVPRRGGSSRSATRDEPANTVTVEVCTKSGQVANPYCPETVTRTFQRGKEPKHVCRIHGPGD